MTFRKHALRAGLIMLLAAAVGWFGVRFGPDTPTAEAKIFERLIYYTKVMPAYRFDDNDSSTPRKTTFNGNTTFLTVSSSTDNISQILDFYELQYPSPPIKQIDPKIFEAILTRANDQRMKDSAQVMADFLACLNANVRFERHGWGLWGSFQFHDEAIEIGSDEHVSKMQNAFESGKLGKLGVGRVVIALRDSKSKHTRVVNLWTGRDFNLKNFLPHNHGDVAGKDILDVPRYPNTRRVLSLEQENAATTDTIVAYEGGGSIANNILFYRTRMRQAGWKTDPFFEKEVKNKSRRDLLFYTRKNRECTIQINKDSRSGVTVSLVIDRTTNRPYAGNVDS